MREAEQLSAQLVRLLLELFPSDRASASWHTAGGAQALLPPEEAQATGLRRALAAACPDRIARLATLCDAPADRQTLATATKTLAAPLIRRAYLSADHAAGQLLWLPPRSPLARHRPRCSYVAFLEVRADGKRPHLIRATAIDPAWLLEAAAPLTRIEPPSLTLPPRYDASTDTTHCWCALTFGPTNWTLPAVPQPPPIEPAWMAAAAFGRAMCAGLVFRTLRPLAPALEQRARALTDASATNRAVIQLRAALAARGVVSRATLAAAWSKEPRFLLRELAALLDEARRAELVEVWPKLLVMSGRAGKKAPTA